MLPAVLSFNARAADTISSVSPANASHSAPVDTDVSATLTDNETSGLSADTFVVRGNQTPTGPNNTSGGGSKTLTVNPFNDFGPGEQVQATVTSGVQTVEGGVDPHVWTFRVGVNEGSGLFRERQDTITGLPPQGRGVALGDVNDDGFLDTVLATFNQNDRVFINAGSGTTGTGYNVLGNSNAYDVSLGDVDGDGDLDIFMAEDNANHVWLNSGSGSFTQSSNSLGSSTSFGVDLGDLDGDGDLDAVVVNGFGADRTWLNEGTGTFVSGDTFSAFSDSFSVALGDVDDDGDLDAFLANNGENEVRRNIGNGNFASTLNSLGGDLSRGVSLGDVDGDGDLDAVVANDGQANRVWLNNGYGVFLPSGNSLGSSPSESVQLGDVDGDGDLDAFFVNYNSANRVWLNSGSGTFTESGHNVTQAGGLDGDVNLGDIDNDGDLDAVLASRFLYGQKVWVNQNDGDGDGFFDGEDNCPEVSNSNQEDLDNDGEGNACDDDVDGDGIPNATDEDDDNDGLDDDSEGAEGGVTFDPDTDNDGVIDGLDRDVDDASNVLSSCSGDIETLNVSISAQFTCAASASITIIEPAEVTGTGDLLVISPEVSIGTGFSVKSGGRLNVISREPGATDP